MERTVILAKRYMETWVKDQLMLHRAEQALTEEQMDFEKQIDEYHRSLLIYLLPSETASAKNGYGVKPEVKSKPITRRTPTTSCWRGCDQRHLYQGPPFGSQDGSAANWSWTNREEDLDQMEKYCITYAEKYSDFNDTWVDFFIH